MSEMEKAAETAAEDVKDEKKKADAAWKDATPELKKEIMDFAEGYMRFLDDAKTEREAVRTIVSMADAAGFRNINDAAELKPGDCVYGVNKNKSIYLAVIGKQPLTQGFNAVGAHIDAPRLDLKQNPLYEDSGLALLKTHYYGGIKKYQWTTVPLALHGVVALTDGTVVDVKIGEDEDDPVFHVTDPVKTAILDILTEKYGMEEEDFRSAEIEAVPAAKARSLGLDRSMVAAYGQDDRVCAYPSFVALMDIAEASEAPERTAVCILSDKEEIGSVGNTGMESHNFELFLMDMLEKTGIVNPYALQRTFSASRALSADVTAAFDPNYPEVMEKRNAAFMGRGISLKKYTGARGKSGASDANAEFVGYVRGVFKEAGVTCQSSEMGKVDEGGGGTIAYILANRGMDVLDCGVPIHSMHSPYESASKYDIYMAYKGYKAFLEK